MRLFSLALLFAACNGGDGGTDTDTGNGTNGEGSDTDPDTASDDPVQDNQRASTGDFASDFLRSTTYDSLLIEVDYVEGHAPSNGALTELVDRMEDLLNKPGGITFMLDDVIPDQGSPTWTVAQTRDLETEYRDEYRDPTSGTAVLYIAYLDGGTPQDEGNSRVLGYAYQGSSIVIFEESVESAGGGGILSGDIEPVVLIHELGHQLGLVNLGTPMVVDHEDVDHLGHDGNEDCIMFFQAETSGVADMMLGGSPDFDDECLNDLAAAGGRPR